MIAAIIHNPPQALRDRAKYLSAERGEPYYIFCDPLTDSGYNVGNADSAAIWYTGQKPVIAYQDGRQVLLNQW